MLININNGVIIALKKLKIYYKITKSFTQG